MDRVRNVRERTRVCALDFGTARVGVALSDEMGFAHPRPPLDARSRRVLLEALARLTEEEKIARFLLGLPVDMSGFEGPAADRVRRFAEQLANTTGVEVELVDERWSTVEASRRLAEAGKRKKQAAQAVDGAAAAVLLQAWLDGRSR